MAVTDRLETLTEALEAGPFAPERPVRSGNSTAARGRRGRADGRTLVARAYQPCVLSWLTGEPTDTLIEQMRNAALRWNRGSLLLSLDRSTQVLLVSDDSQGGPSRARLRDAVRSVVEVARAARPEAQIHTAVGDRIRPGDRLAVAASRLRRIRRYASAHGGDEVVWARRYSLACLLETVDPRQASAFAEGQLASLRAHDREHGTNLQRVLELALDHANRNTAADAAFMHRNTFRRQLRRALELIDVDLACPEERLALHVALKMRELEQVGAPG
jgi:sugar diacid utilization regulator